jgi:hypothetical protein
LLSEPAVIQSDTVLILLFYFVLIKKNVGVNMPPSKAKEMTEKKKKKKKKKTKKKPQPEVVIAWPSDCGENLDKEDWYLSHAQAVYNALETSASMNEVEVRAEGRRRHRWLRSRINRAWSIVQSDEYSAAATEQRMHSEAKHGEEDVVPAVDPEHPELLDITAFKRAHLEKYPLDIDLGMHVPIAVVKLLYRLGGTESFLRTKGTTWLCYLLLFCAEALNNKATTLNKFGVGVCLYFKFMVRELLSFVAPLTLARAVPAALIENPHRRSFFLTLPPFLMALYSYFYMV